MIAELHIKTRCVAVPVQDGHGRNIAAISASDAIGRMTPAREVKIMQALYEAAARLQKMLYAVPGRQRIASPRAMGAAL